MTGSHVRKAAHWAMRTALAATACLVLATGCAAPTASPVSPSAPTPPAAGAPAGAVNPNAPEAAAAGDVPDNQVFVPYTVANGRFVVSVPEGWGRRSDGDATVFSDRFNSIRLQTGPAPRAPDLATARSVELPRIKAATPGYRGGDVRPVSRSAGPAVVITYQADSPPNPVTGKKVTEEVERYEFWHQGRAAVVILSGPVGADNVDPWRTVTDSLRWLP
jgi:hypothetical protein